MNDLYMIFKFVSILGGIFYFVFCMWAWVTLVLKNPNIPSHTAVGYALIWPWLLKKEKYLFR